MKRIVWVAVTILIMLGIMGIGLHTLNNIDDVNQRRREKEAGEKMASQIAATTASTSIWDKLRETTETTSGTAPDVGNTDTVASEEGISTDVMQEESGLSTASVPEQENPFSEVDTAPAVQTVTTTTEFVVYID